MLRTILTACLTLLVFLCYSQDANYWSSNYGPGGFFTPGAVVANNRDSGVFFYNPAVLGFSQKSSTSISANIYQLQSIKIKNGVGTGKDLKSAPTSIVPLMASGTIAIKGITIGYALINDPTINFGATQRKDERINVLSDSYSPGVENFIGQFSLQNISTQTTAMLSVAKKLAPNLSAGISFEGMLHKQTYDLSYSSRVLWNATSDTIFPPLTTVVLNYLARYTYFGLRFKAGVAYDAGNHHLGLMITSPLVRMGGTGTIVADEVVNNLKDPTLGITFNLLASDRQEKLKAHWKTPVSIAGGYIYDYGKGQISFTSEYFTSIKEYNVLTPRTNYFIRPDTGNNAATTALLKFKSAGKALANFAVGFSYQLKENVTGFLSLRTDLTYADEKKYADDDGETPNTTSWNMYHMQVGANMKKRKFNLRAGLLVGYGSTHTFHQEINYDDPKESNFLLGEPVDTKAKSFSVGLMFSYIHNL